MLYVLRGLTQQVVTRTGIRNAKPMVVESFSGGYPLARILVEHLVNQVLCLSTDLVPVLRWVGYLAPLVL